MTISRSQVEAWLERWAQAIRDGDFAAGRAMFADDVVGFGSVTAVMHGIDALVADQWRQVWPKTQGFVFEPPHLLMTTAEIAVVAAEWRSEGLAESGRYDRHGRTTLVLQSTPAGLICVHSHFSMLPRGESLRADSISR